jgi:enoyl-CoA hydratase/carnithine racemase
MMGTYNDLSIEVAAGGVAVVSFNRPEKLNALSHNLRRELISALGALGADEQVGAIVLTGSGGHAFAAGQDLAEAQTFDAAKVSQWVTEWLETYRALGQCPKPLIAAINGYAVGAAFQLALLCDLRIASETARFGMLEVDDGIPCITGTWLLYEFLGRGRTTELVLTTRFVEAEQALAWGLVSQVVPFGELKERAIELAQTIGAKPRLAVLATRQWLWRLLQRDWPMTEDYVKLAQTQAYLSGEAQEAMASFLAKRARQRSR